MRQAWGWAIISLQGFFPRMKYRFMYEDKGEIVPMLHCTAKLFNIRSSMVGIIQIVSTYIAQLSAEVLSS